MYLTLKSLTEKLLFMTYIDLETGGNHGAMCDLSTRGCEKQKTPVTIEQIELRGLFDQLIMSVKKGKCYILNTV